jgi:hypothetical protein
MITNDDFNPTIASYFQDYFKNSAVNTDIKLIDLGFESIDYIDLANFLLKTSNKWLDISQISRDTKISDIASCLIDLKKGKSGNKKMVKLDNFRKYAYSYQLNDEHCKYNSYIIHCLHLKEHIDISKLEQAIIDTLNNHFMLNSRLVRICDDYYFESAAKQSNITFKGSFLFPHRDISKLMISMQSDRLVNIYLQRKKKHNYLIISFHHVALDGWSHKMIQEQIFRRYAGIYNLEKIKESEEINALCNTYSLSINEKSNPEELLSILNPININQYNHIDKLFCGRLRRHYNGFLITKDELDSYAWANNISDFPYSVIFIFMMHQMINRLILANKLIFHISLSNRYLAFSGVKELVTNIITALPVFLDNKDLNEQQFAEKIKEIIDLYFKHMSHGAITRILLENNTLLNSYISAYRQPYYLMLTYINNTSKIIYGDDSICSNYINWDKSKNYINNQHRRGIFLDIHNMGKEFLIHFHSRMVDGKHLAIVDNFFKLSFPNIVSSNCY